MIHRLPPRDPAFLLELAQLPMLELRRPRDWDAAADARERLLDAVTPLRQRPLPERARNAERPGG